MDPFGCRSVQIIASPDLAFTHFSPVSSAPTFGSQPHLRPRRQQITDICVKYHIGYHSRALCILNLRIVHAQIKLLAPSSSS